jgi:hypothetical protein
MAHIMTGENRVKYNHPKMMRLATNIISMLTYDRHINEITKKGQPGAHSSHLRRV